MSVIPDNIERPDHRESFSIVHGISAGTWEKRKGTTMAFVKPNDENQKEMLKHLLDIFTSPSKHIFLKIDSKNM